MSTGGPLVTRTWRWTWWPHTGREWYGYFALGRQERWFVAETRRNAGDSTYWLVRLGALRITVSWQRRGVP